MFPGPVITEHGGFGLAAEAEIASRPLRGLGEKGVGQQDNVPLRWRRGGIHSPSTLMRKYRSARKVPSRTIETKSRLVAAIMRMSMGMGVSAPMRRMLCSWQDTQQLALHGGRDLTDLIQKNSSGMGTLEQSPLAVPAGSGKGSLYIAEQLTFQNAFWEGGAVDSHKWHVPPAAGR